MEYEKVVAVYDRLDKAKDAARALQASGFSSSDISLLSRDSIADAEVHEVGLWRRLFGGNVRDHEGVVYGRTIEAGGGVLSLRVPQSDVPRAMKILDVHYPVNVNERATNFGLEIPPEATKTTAPPPPLAAKAVAAAAGAGAGLGLVGKDELVLRLAEEQLDVGKRQVQTGMTRIRRFVTEKPVEAQITLHEEHAQVARRSASDPALAKDIDWTDKTVEIIETTEQAVISKTARVSEEVVIRREGSDRVETVHDTIRRQQVEIDRSGKDPKEKDSKKTA